MTAPTEPPEMPDTEPTDTEPTETEPTARTEPEGEKPAADRYEGGTVPVWWQWVGRHRKAVLIAAGVLVVALVATFVVRATTSPGPEDVVNDYLDALRAGDTDAALDIVGKPDPGGKLDFVHTDAMADGWTVDSVVVRNERDYNDTAEADVDVTFSTKNESRQGRFHVVERDGGWRIESPFVHVTLEVKGMESITLGRVTRKVLRAEPAGGVSVLAFPGVYRLDLGNRVSLSPNEFIVAPRPDQQLAQSYTPTMKLSDEGTEQAQRAIDAYLDECAEQTEADPVGCPFSADDVVGYWAAVNSLAWEITAYPQGIFEPSDTGGFRMITRKPGTVRLTGTGFEEDPPAKRFTATCEFGIGDPAWGLLTVDISGDEVTVNTGSSGSLAADLATRCH